MMQRGIERVGVTEPVGGSRTRREAGSSLRSDLNRALVLGLLSAGVLSGCASVAPYEKEHLADPILALDAETPEEAREVKWLEAREGSTGGVGGAGGGCACN